MRHDNDHTDFGDRITRYYLYRLIFAVVGLALIGYVSLLAYAPLIWAVVTAGLFVLGLGLLSTKIILHIESPGLMWFLTPVFGMIWLLFFFLLWLVKQSVMP